MNEETVVWQSTLTKEMVEMAGLDYGLLSQLIDELDEAVVNIASGYGIGGE